MQIKTLEERTGLSRDTIRFYERSGLITPPRRLHNGYRHYDDLTLAELKFIAAARDVGFTLAEIKPAIPHLKAPPEKCHKLVDKLLERKQIVREQIALHRKQLRRLDELVERFSGAST